MKTMHGSNQPNTVNIVLELSQSFEAYLNKFINKAELLS